MFCNKCGSLLVPIEGKMGCSACNTVSDSDGCIKEKKIEQKELEVMEKSNESMPQTDADCGKCKNTKAYFWTAQTRSSDEPETIFLKCTKCDHQWRQY